MARGLEVRCWACDPTSTDYTRGPVMANNDVTGSGMTLSVSNGKQLKAETIKWEHIPWRVAVDAGSGVLYVLCPDRNTVESHRAALERLAVVVYQYGGLDNVRKEQAKTIAGTVTPRMETKANAPRPSDKRLALNGITTAVQDALALGASMQDIRLAVYSAMGLDSDAA